MPELEAYIGVDVPPYHRPTLPSQLSEVPQRAGEAVTDPRFMLIISEHGSQMLMLETFPYRVDAVFIDGDHSRVVVRQDSLLAFALVHRGGLIVWHDYGNPATEVAECLDQLHRDGWPIVHVEGTWIAYMQI
jgi:hypothetical protein